MTGCKTSIPRHHLPLSPCLWCYEWHSFSQISSSQRLCNCEANKCAGFATYANLKFWLSWENSLCKTHRGLQDSIYFGRFNTGATDIVLSNRIDSPSPYNARLYSPYLAECLNELGWALLESYGCSPELLAQWSFSSRAKAPQTWRDLREEKSKLYQERSVQRKPPGSQALNGLAPRNRAVISVSSPPTHSHWLLSSELF